MTAVSPIVLDAGNGGIKVRCPVGEVKEDWFPHAIVKMSEADYQRVASRTAKPDPDYIRINGIPYGIGEKGLRHGRFQLRHGSHRYTPAYYGVFLAGALTPTFQKSMRGVFLMGSHAPKDIDYATDLLTSAVGKWEVEWMGEQYRFDVVDGTTFDEPQGGWAN